MTSSYDAWLSTDRAEENSSALHAAFSNSPEYLTAYVDYTEDFESSAAYDKAFEAWIADDDIDTDEWLESDGGDPFDATEYYGLHAEDNYDHTEHLHGQD